MLGCQARGQQELVFAGSLRDLIPDDHVLARVDRVLELGWLRAEVADCYAAGSGRPGIDPEVAVRLMLAGLLLGFVHDRRLMREAAVNIAIRWCQSERKRDPGSASNRGFCNGPLAVNCLARLPCRRCLASVRGRLAAAT